MRTELVGFIALWLLLALCFWMGRKSALDERKPFHVEPAPCYEEYYDYFPDWEPV